MTIQDIFNAYKLFYVFFYRQISLVIVSLTSKIHRNKKIELGVLKMNSMPMNTTTKAKRYAFQS